MLIQAAADTAVRVFAPYDEQLQALALGGDRTAVRHTLAADGRLARLAGKSTERFLTVPDPRRHVLEGAIKDVYAVEVVAESAS